MQFTISSKALESHLSLLTKEVASKCSMPMMSMLLLELKADTLTLTTANEDKSHISVYTKVTEQEEGEEKRILVNPTSVSKAIQGLAEQNIIFATKENNMLEISYAEGKVSIRYEVIKEYPAPAELKTDGYAHNTISGKALTDGIKRCIYSTTNDLVRPITTSVYIECTSKSLLITGTDGRRVVSSQYSLDNGEPCSLMLPKRIAKIVQGINASSVELFTSGSSECEFELLINGCIRIGGNGVQGKYPDYKNLLKQNIGKITATAARDNLINILSRATYFAMTSRVKLTFKAGELEVQGKDKDMDMDFTQKMPITFEGDETYLGISSTYLCEILRSYNAENVEIRLQGDPSKPIVLKQNDDDCKVLAMLMPMLLED